MSGNNERFELFSAIPFFDGESNGVPVDEFLDKIDMVGILQKWSDDTKLTIAKIKLKGKARLAVKHCQLLKNADWNKFKEELTEYYSLPDFEVRKQLINCRQRRNETTRDWSWRFLEIASKCGLIGISNAENSKMIKEAIETEDWCRIYLRNVDGDYYDMFVTKQAETPSGYPSGYVSLNDLVNEISNIEHKMSKIPPRDN